MQPLVSCLTPTQAGREEMLKLAILDFTRQTWENKEMVIVFRQREAAAAFEPYVASLGRDDIHVYSCVDPNATLGTSRNLTNDLAKGVYCATWDDDDRHHPERLARHYQTLVDRTVAWSYLNQQIHLFPETGDAFWIDWRGHRSPGYVFYPATKIRYITEGELAMRGEDKMFLRSFDAAGLTAAPVQTVLPLYIRYFHGTNAWNHKHHWTLANGMSVTASKLLEHKEGLIALLKSFDIKGKLTFRSGQKVAVFDYE